MVTLLQKKEAILFSAIDIAFDKRNFQVNNSVLPYKNQPKTLDIVLDENMTFKSHIQKVEKKASRELNVIREVKYIAEKYLHVQRKSPTCITQDIHMA